MKHTSENIQLSLAKIQVDSYPLRCLFSDKGLVYVGLQTDEDKPWKSLTQKFTIIESVDNIFSEKLHQQLSEYFSGERLSFNIPIDFLEASDFQKSVWQSLLNIPFGTRVSYQAIAEMIGQEMAYRAVATAIAVNPILIICPCHRVIKKSGQIGNYRGGVGMKRTLLDFEASHK